MRKSLMFDSSDFNKQYKNTFPYRIIDGLAGEFTAIYCKRLEVPPEFMYISFLTCLGSILSKSLTLATEIRPQPRLYVLLLGQSADDRKSTAIDKTNEFFDFALNKNISGDTRRLNICHGVGSAEGLAKQLKKYSNLLLCYDEFKSFVSKAKISSSTLLQCVSSLFESNYYENQTGKTEIFIENGFLSMLAASTIQTYEASWDKSFTAIGFNNRVFIVPGSGKRRESMPPKIPDEDKRDLALELYQILNFVGELREVGITTRAKQLFHEWYMNRPTSIHSKRLDGYALRFMVLMAINNMIETIDENIVNNTIELMDWQFEMRQMYDPLDADNTMALMEEKIRRVLSNHKKSDRELKQATNANRTGLFFFANAKKNLQSAGEIVFNPKEKKWGLVDK